MLPFAPDGPRIDLPRVVRDDFIAHLCAGGTAEAAVSELRAAYRPALVGSHASAQVLVTLALTAWETGRLPSFLQQEVCTLLERLDPHEGVSVAEWAAEARRIVERVQAPQPPKVDLRAAAARPPWPEGSVLQCASQKISTPWGLFLVLDKHWVHGAFHALAVALDLDADRLRLLAPDPIVSPPVFVLGAGDPQLHKRADLNASRDQRRKAQRHIQHIHARLIPPQERQVVYARLRAPLQ